MLDGSDFVNGKFRIMEQFNKSSILSENAVFLKGEYGIGGRSGVHTYSEYTQFHDGKGLCIRKGYTDTAPNVLLSWQEVAKQIGTLIEQDRYLNENEKKQYTAWQSEKGKQPSYVSLTSDDAAPAVSDELQEQHTFRFADHAVEAAGKKERFRRNVEAIRLLKQCQTENRMATPEEQIRLSKYVGWGGLPETFDLSNGAWMNEYSELKNILTAEEYASAQENTLTAFYTPPVVIQAIYATLERLGFREGNILEPSCGIGHFIGFIPDSMQNSRMFGVEMDTISAGIASQLYQSATIAAQPFENIHFPDNHFDVVVGNVPFGNFRESKGT